MLIPSSREPRFTLSPFASIWASEKAIVLTIAFGSAALTVSMTAATTSRENGKRPMLRTLASSMAMTAMSGSGVALLRRRARS